MLGRSEDGGAIGFDASQRMEAGENNITIKNERNDPIWMNPLWNGQEIDY